MNRPHVIVHNMVSIDGRTDHFAGDVGLYYELVAALPHDAVLSGSATFLSAAAAEGIHLSGEDPLPTDDLEDPVPAGTAAPDPTAVQAPLLVIVDSRGQLTRFGWLTGTPYWRGLLIACSASTPPDHLGLLERHRIPFVIVGDDRVDLPRLLAVLATDHGIERVRVDSGGVLNGALLRAGLVDEVSLLIGAYAVGGRSPAGLFVADEPADGAVVPLELLAVERLRGDAVWLRYRVLAAA
jgi:2,5-diamino-6-(ribosylamino)-4(3H)-pyrimidinone 5'-phosphate reductase